MGGHYATSRRVAGSIPDEVNEFFNLPNNYSSTIDLGSTKSGRRVGLTTLPPSMSRMSEYVGALTSRNPKGLHGLCRDNFTFHCLLIKSIFSILPAAIRP
jgi:hypothetical protein